MAALTEATPTTAATPKAVLWRMATPEHLCPFGLKSRDLLRRQGFEVEDHLLTSRGEQDAFKAEYGVKTTPQAWIGGERIGGHDDLRRHFGFAVPDKDALTYAPVGAIFGMALALSVALSWVMRGAVVPGLTLWWFLGLATALLAVQKLRDVETFTNGFLGYDLLARRDVRYAYAFPWLEAGVGVLMVAGVAPWLSVPVALVIGMVGAASVAKAVYVEHRDLRCACVGGGSNVPLGFISLSENLAMIAMGLWMLLAAVGSVPMPV